MLAYHTIIALIFVMVCLRYHTVLWVNKSEYLPYEGIKVLLLFSTVATHMKQAISFLKIPIPSEPTACLLRAHHKKFYQSDNLFRISLKEKWKRLSG
jgi:hypothetical protein